VKEEHVRILVSAILLLAICAIPLTADQTCKPVVGDFEALVVPPDRDIVHPYPEPSAQPAASGEAFRATINS